MHSYRFRPFGIEDFQLQSSRISVHKSAQKKEGNGIALQIPHLLRGCEARSVSLQSNASQPCAFEKNIPLIGKSMDIKDLSFSPCSIDLSVFTVFDFLYPNQSLWHLGSVKSLTSLHSAIVFTGLKSIIAADSSR